MKIRIVGQAGEPTFTFNNNNPWAKFKNNLIEKKDVIISQKFGENIDVLICHGYSMQAVREAKKSKISKNRMFLVLWEPPIVHPKLHSNKYLSNFGHIYAPSKEWAKNYKAVYFKWPVGKITANSSKNNFNSRNKNAVIIQGNKVNLFKGENYSLRRTVLFKSLRLSNPIMLYGIGWKKSPVKQMVKAVLNSVLHFKYGLSKKGLKYLIFKYPNALGAAKNKFTTLKKYKISVVIENHNSYVSEKIFDSLNSGCVTIYMNAAKRSLSLRR